MQGLVIDMLFLLRRSVSSIRVLSAGLVVIPIFVWSVVRAHLVLRVDLLNCIDRSWLDCRELEMDLFPPLVL